MVITVKNFLVSEGQMRLGLVDGLKNGKVKFTGFDKAKTDDQKKVKAIFGKDWSDGFKSNGKGKGKIDVGAIDTQAGKLFAQAKELIKQANVALAAKKPETAVRCHIYAHSNG